MALIDEKIVAFTSLIASLPIRPNADGGLTADELQAYWDESSEELRLSVNGIIDRLISAAGAGDLGAVAVTGGTAVTVQAILNELKAFIDTKAVAADTYTETEVNNLLNAKADKATTYTKTETDSALALKANQATTYTKTETDNALASVVLGQIPDGSIVDAKLSNTPGQIKDVVGDHTVQLAVYSTPEMYGAVGDGITDDKIAINLAIASAKTIEFKNTTYLVSDILTIPSDRTIIGNNCKINSTKVTTNTANVQADTCLFINGSNVSVSGFNINSDGNPLGIGAVNNVTVRDISVSLRNATSYGSMFWLNGCTNVHMENLTMDGLVGGSYGNDGLHINAGCHDIYVDNIKGTCKDDFIALNCPEGPYAGGNIYNVYIDGISTTYSYGIRLYGYGGSYIKNCKFSNLNISTGTSIPAFRALNSNGLGGQSLEDLHLENVVVEHGYFTSNYHPVYFARMDGDITFRDCKIEATGASMHGIFTENSVGGTTGPEFELNVYNCEITSLTGQPVRLLAVVGNAGRTLHKAKFADCMIKGTHAVILGEMKEVVLKNCHLDCATIYGGGNVNGTELLVIDTCLTYSSLMNATTGLWHLHTTGTKYINYTATSYPFFINPANTHDILITGDLQQDGIATCNSGGGTFRLRGLFMNNFTPNGTSVIGDRYIDSLTFKYVAKYDGGTFK